MQRIPCLGFECNVERGILELHGKTASPRFAWDYSISTAYALSLTRNSVYEIRGGDRLGFLRDDR